MFLQSNIIISFSAGLLTFGVASFCQNKQALLLGLFMLFSTLCIYNALRIIKFFVNPSSPQAISNRRYNKVYYIFGLAGLIGVLLCFFKLTLSGEMWFWLGLATLISVFYVIPIFPMNGVKVALRDLPGIKIILIASSWSLLCFYLPAMESGQKGFFFLLGFIYIISVTIPFDIRDLPFDNPIQKTIPQLFGWEIARSISVILSALFFVLLASEFPEFYFRWYFWGIALLHLFILSIVNPKRSQNYYGFFVDGAISLVGFLFLLESSQ